MSASFACQRYATATNPMGPWTHRGIVLGQVSSTTNHAGVAQFNGQWYMVYHNANAPGGGNFRRSVAVDRMFFNADGTIQRVVQTTTGPPPNPGPGGGANHALTASRSTSYVSPWENLAAINDGFTPTSSGDRAHPVYGNWPQQGTHWVQYDWATPVTLRQASVYWFDDNQGIDLPASCQVQYWNGSSFVTNADDQCTTLPAHSLALGNWRGGLAACETAPAAAPVAMVNGRGLLRMLPPGSGNAGSTDLTLHLGITATGQRCTAIGAAPVAALPANLPWLQTRSTGSAAYDQNPSARISFGQYRSPVIHFRELY